MNYRDIIREMKSSGHWSEADELERAVRDSHCSEYDRVCNRSDARDGLSMMSYAGDMAERAYDDIKYAERREREREEEQERLEAERARQQHEWQRQQEEEYWQQQEGP